MKETIIMGEVEKPLHPFERAGLGKAPFRVDSFSVELFSIPGTGIIKAGASCDYCGTAIANTYWIRSSDGQKFKVGSECVRKTRDLSLIKEVKTHQKKVAKEKREKKVAEKREARRIEREKEAAVKSIAFLATRPELQAAFEVADQDPVLASMRDSLGKWGSLTENQIKYALKLADLIRNPKPVEVKVAVKEGKREITGTVLSIKTSEYMGQTQWRMLVKTSDGEKIFGTCPRSILETAINEKGYYDFNLLIGKTVKFNATIIRSEQDEFFGFFKRPTKPEVVS